jgi:glycosyltransferase involved in cell wall biosynthesis
MAHAPPISGYMEARHAALARSLAEVDSIVCPSQYVAGRMRAAFGAGLDQKLAVVGHGVRELARVFREENHSALRVAFIGRFNDRKGADVLIAAARMLAGERIVFEVWGHTEARVEAQARAAGILIRGPYDAQQLEAGLRGIDLVAVPSTMEESYCLVVDEAMRMGIPVAAAKTGAIPERVRDGENGFLFPTGEPQALARLLCALRDDRARIHAVAARLRDWPLKSLEENAREYLAMYRRLARRAAPPTPQIAPAGELARRSMGVPRDRACTPLGTDDYDRWLRREPPATASGGKALPVVILRSDGAGEAEARRVNAAVRDTPAEWIALHEEGDVLAPHALERLAGACASNALASLIYTDHDSISLRGERYDPCMKPAFGTELARNAACVAGLCAVRRDAFLAAGGLREPGWPGVAELASRLAAGGRLRSVVAWPELLCHRLDTKNGKMDGARPAPARAPGGSVSVLVRAGNSPQLALACIDSLMRSAGKAVEQVMLDLDDAACAEIAKLRPGLRITCVNAQPNRSALGAALEEATGERVAIVDARCLRFREGWLSQLEATLGDAAGACIAVRAADRVVPGWDVIGGGPHAVAGIAPAMEADALGELYGGAREVGALGARLSIFHRDSARNACAPRDLDSAGPFDLAHLSLALRDQGYRLLANPTVAAELHGKAASLQSAPKDRTQVAWMRERWGARLEDPFVHRSLRVTGNRFAVQPRFGARRPGVVRVCAFPYDRWGSGEMRVRQPVRALEREGRAEVETMAEHDSGDAPNPLELARMDPDVVLAHNFLHDYQLLALEQYAEHSPALRVTGLDDLLTAIPEANPYFATIYPDIAMRIARCVAMSDRLVVSTRQLAEAYGHNCRDVRVVPNALDEAWLGLRNAKRAGQRPRVGWAGARQHAGDLAIIEPVVRATCKEIDWVFLGMCPPSLAGIAKEVHPMAPVREYPARLASLGLDVAVAPLEDHAFNRAKSNLRLLEYGILGIPVVASAVAPYVDSPATLVANDLGSWVEAVRSLACDPGRRESEGEGIRRWVMQAGLLRDRLALWEAVLRRDG